MSITQPRNGGIGGKPRAFYLRFSLEVSDQLHAPNHVTPEKLPRVPSEYEVEGAKVGSQQMQRIFLFTISSGSTLRPKQPPVHKSKAIISARGKRLGCETDHLLISKSRLKMRSPAPIPI
jgi:hypothetical protein